MVERRGLFGRIAFWVVTLAWLYVAAYILVASMVQKEGSILGALTVLFLMWWVYSRLIGIVEFAFGRDEISYDEYKGFMRERGYEVVEGDLQTASDLPIQASETPARRSSGGGRVPGNPTGGGGNDPQIRVRIGTDSQRDNEIMHDITDFFRAT